MVLTAFIPKKNASSKVLSFGGFLGYCRTKHRNVSKEGKIVRKQLRPISIPRTPFNLSLHITGGEKITIDSFFFDFIFVSFLTKFWVFFGSQERQAVSFLINGGSHQPTPLRPAKSIRPRHHNRQQRRRLCGGRG